MDLRADPLESRSRICIAIQLLHTVHAPLVRGRQLNTTDNSIQDEKHTERETGEAGLRKMPFGARSDNHFAGGPVGKNAPRTTSEYAHVPVFPVMTQPWLSVSWNMCVTVSATMSLSGTFFCVMMTALSSPRKPMLVTAPLLMALKAYSAKSIGRQGNVHVHVGSGNCAK